MSIFEVGHYTLFADGQPKEAIEIFKFDDMYAAQQKYREIINRGGEPDTGIFYFDNSLFGGDLQKHYFDKKRKAY